MRDKLAEHVYIYAKTNLPTIYGNFKVYVFHNNLDRKEHLAIVNGVVQEQENVVLRIHSECLTSEVLGSLKCDCREQLQTALKYIASQESGIVLYMRQEGRGIGLGNKIRAYALQEQGYDTVEANHRLGFPDDLRQYDLAAAMLHKLKIKSVRILTNNPSKITALEEFGIPVRERVSLEIEPTHFNRFYLYTKAKKSGHLLDIDKGLTQIDMAV